MAASPWGGAHFFSLWYPAAGVRLALLWRIGARFTPVLIVEECVIQLLTGTIVSDGPEFLNQLGGVARAPAAYGLMIALVRFIERRSRSELAIAPMPFGLAAVLAPTLVSFTAGFWEWLWPGVSGTLPSQPIATTIAAFLVGDLLGVLLVAPPLLWIGTRNEEARRLMQIGRGRAVEAAAVFVFAWLLAWGLARVEPQIAVTPVLIGAIWVGLRCGRLGAWIAIILSASTRRRSSCPGRHHCRPAPPASRCTWASPPWRSPPISPAALPRRRSAPARISPGATASCSRPSG